MHTTIPFRNSTLLLLLVAALFLPADLGAEEPPEATYQTLWSTYWTVEPGFTSTLEMKNNRIDRALYVRASLYFANGEEYYLESLHLEPRQTVVINLNQVHESLPAPMRARVGKEGAVEVSFRAPSASSLMGGVSIVNPDRRVAWNFRLYGRAPALPLAPLAGVFWFYDSQSDGFVALQNVSEETIHVTPRLYVNGAVHALAPIRLWSDQVYKLKLGRELRNLGLSGVTAGGIELAYEGPSEALVAHGALFNRRGFSAEITFLRRASGSEERPFSVRTPRVAIGPADPRLGLPASTTFEPLLALANLGEGPLTAQLIVGFQAEESIQQVQLPVVLEGRESRVVRLADELQGILPPGIHWVSLEVSYASREAQLVAGVTSVSRDGQHSVGAVLNHVEGSVAEGWHWQVDGDSTTLLGILNADTEEATVQVWLDYFSDGQAGRYDLPESVIPGRGTALIDLSEFVASGQPDPDGDVIPAGVTFGGYRVRKVAGGTNRRLTTEALIVNRRTKTFLPLYNTCCGYSDVQVEPDQINGNVGSQHLIALFATNTCSFAEEALWATFSSSNSTVASVENFDGIGRVTLNNPGTATVTGSAFVDFAEPGCDPGMQPGFDGDGGFGGDFVCCSCISAQRSDSSSVTAKPTVQFTGGNSYIFAGTDPTVKASNLQQAQGNPSGGTYSWSAAPTNRISSFENLSPPGLVRLTGNAPSTALLDTTLTVNYSLNAQNATPATKNITVRIFKFLQQSGQVQVIAINGPDVFGYDATVFYNIFTNPSGQQVQPGHGGMTVVEVVNTVSITINGQPADIPIDLTTSSGATTANSQIVDQLRLTRQGQPLPSGLDVTSTQDLAVGGIFVRNNTLHFLTNTVTVTNNGPFN